MRDPTKNYKALTSHERPYKTSESHIKELWNLKMQPYQALQVQALRGLTRLSRFFKIYSEMKTQLS
jgi:hypothetical protein